MLEVLLCFKVWNIVFPTIAELKVFGVRLACLSFPSHPSPPQNSTSGGFWHSLLWERMLHVHPIISLHFFQQTQCFFFCILFFFHCNLFCPESSLLLRVWEILLFAGSFFLILDSDVKINRNNIKNSKMR